MKNILFPTDFSSETRPVLDWVRVFARQFEATVIILHVFEPQVRDTTLPTFSDPGVGLSASGSVEELSQRRLTELVDQLTAEGLVARSDWRTGDVENEIMSAVKTYQADLIITMPTTGSSFFDRLSGSAALDLARDATCPVLVVPEPGEDTVTRPAQVQTIVYVMQPDSTQAQASAQTAGLTDAFGATLHFATLDQLDQHSPDLIVVMDYKRGGLFTTDPVQKVLKRDVPVLVYHLPEKS